MLLILSLVPSYHGICILYSFYKNALKDYFVICQGHVSIFNEILCKSIFYTVIALQVLWTQMKWNWKKLDIYI